MGRRNPLDSNCLKQNLLHASGLTFSWVQIEMAELISSLIYDIITRNNKPLFPYLLKKSSLDSPPRNVFIFWDFFLNFS